MLSTYIHISHVVLFVRNCPKHQCSPFWHFPQHCHYLKCQLFPWLLHSFDPFHWWSWCHQPASSALKHLKWNFCTLTWPLLFGYLTCIALAWLSHLNVCLESCLFLPVIWGEKTHMPHKSVVPLQASSPLQTLTRTMRRYEEARLLF